jgi:hypothetical protein
MNRFIWVATLPLLFLLSACNNEPKTAETSPAAQENTPAPTAAPSADVDAHGCNASGGMVWSELRQSCLALFESGVRMVPQDSFLRNSMAAFVVKKSDFDDTQVQIFIPQHEELIILDKQKDGTWKNDSYVVTNSGKDYAILDGKDKHLLYKGTEGK